MKNIGWVSFTVSEQQNLLLLSEQGVISATGGWTTNSSVKWVICFHWIVACLVPGSITQLNLKAIQTRTCLKSQSRSAMVSRVGAINPNIQLVVNHWNCPRDFSVSCYSSEVLLCISFDLVSAAEVCSLFCPSGGEAPTESALSSAKRGKTPGQSVIIIDWATLWYMWRYIIDLSIFICPMLMRQNMGNAYWAALSTLFKTQTTAAVLWKTVMQEKDYISCNSMFEQTYSFGTWLLLNRLSTWEWCLVAFLQRQTETCHIEGSFVSFLRLEIFHVRFMCAIPLLSYQEVPSETMTVIYFFVVDCLAE